jgi:hypothetical protein
MNTAGCRPPQDWFEAASHDYVEGHQRCAACGERHCVFRTESDALVEFYCYSCDFSACHDRRTGRYYVWDRCAATPQVPAVLAALAEQSGS